MIKFCNNINDVDYNKRLELIERSSKIIKLIENNRTRSNYSNGLEWKLSKAKSLYWLKYNEVLNVEELTILYLYITFPNDAELLNLLNRYDNNFIKIANVYGVSPSFIKLRYTSLLFMEMNKQKDDEPEHSKPVETPNAHKTLKLTLDLK